MAMSLPTLPKVQKLQAALHAKAKGSPASLGELAESLGVVDYHAVRRLCQWLCKKHKVRGPSSHDSQPNTGISNQA